MPDATMIEEIEKEVNGSYFNKLAIELYEDELATEKHNAEFNDTKLQKRLEISTEQNEPDSAKLRDCIAFWLLACCNNFGYTLLLTAAHDILKDSGSFLPEDGDVSLSRDCNLISTGIILLADSLPGLIVIIVGSFIPVSAHIRMASVILTYVVGLLLVGLSSSVWIAILGTAITSLSGGLGELTCLSHSVHFPASVLSGWASGNAAGGLIGSFALSTFTLLGLTAHQTVLIATCIPILMAVTFWGILSKVDKTNQINANETIVGQKNIQKTITSTTRIEKLKSLPSLLKYIIPILSIYFFQYTINQGLTELVQFDDVWIDHSTQYHWIQVVYQTGKFLAQSSRGLIQIDKLWILIILQFLNFIFFSFEAIFYITPYLPIVFIFSLWEGIVGGIAYLNVYRRIRNEVPPNNQDFALVMTSLADSCGIASSGFTSIPIHNFICQLPKPTRPTFS